MNLAKRNCTSCKVIKTVDNFNKTKRRTDGYHTWCKVCTKQYYLINREKILKQKRKKFNENRDLFSSRNKNQYKKHIESRLYTAAKRRAKLKNLPFNISISDINIPEFCPVLNIKLVSNVKYSQFNSPSLDRINPKLGYVPDNVIVISLHANQIKNDASLLELEKVYTFYKNLGVDF